MVDKKSKVKKIVIASALAVVAVGGGMVAGAIAFPKEIVSVQTKIVDASQEQLDKAYANGVASVVIPEPTVVTEYKEVPVDNGNLELVLNHIYDNKGNIEYITEDLNDDEVDLIVDRILLVNDFKSLAVDAVKKDLFKELDDKIVSDITLDKKDLEKLKIDSDAEEILIQDIDFEDKDATLLVTGSFKQDDIKFNYEASISFKDGEYDEIEDIVVTKE